MPRIFQAPPQEPQPEQKKQEVIHDPKAQLLAAMYRQYQVDSAGRVQARGKFYGQFVYVPYFYQLYANGTEPMSTDESTGELVVTMTVEAEDRELFPALLGNKQTVKFVEREGNDTRTSVVEEWRDTKQI